MASPALSRARGLTTGAAGRAKRGVRSADSWIRRRGGWWRIVRNAVIAYRKQSGNRVAAALSYYTIFVSGPILILALWLGAALFGEETTKAVTAEVLRGALPPRAHGAADVISAVIQASTPAAGLALAAGLGSAFGFTRTLSKSLNAALNVEGREPLGRSLRLMPVLLATIVGLVAAAWGLEILEDVIKLTAGVRSTWRLRGLLEGLGQLALAIIFFSVILRTVPRTRLEGREILVPSIIGGLLWEAVRSSFGWLVDSDSAYSQVFGPLGDMVALLAWVYVSAAVLLLTGQIAWAYAMEHRGLGNSASLAPQEAGLDGRPRPPGSDNAVNEDRAC